MDKSIYSYGNEHDEDTVDGIEPMAKISRLDEVVVKEEIDSSSSKSDYGMYDEYDDQIRNLCESSSFSKVNEEDDLSKRYEDEQKCAMMEPSFREFDVLDEARDSEEYCSTDSSYYSSDDGSDVPDDEIDMMLDENLPQSLRCRRRTPSKSAAKEFVRKLLQGVNGKPNGENNAYSDGAENNPDAAESNADNNAPNGASQDHGDGYNNDNVECRTKVILEELEINHFDLLPEGWIKLTHKSGMPVYLHRKSRVCTMSRPYYLGPGSARNHSTPLSAIPCLQYKRALANEKKNAEKIKEENTSESNDNLCLHKARIETAAENHAAQSLDPMVVREYCEPLFVFKTINSMKYKSWVTRRKQVKQKKQEEQRKRLTLPDGTKLLKFPIVEPGGSSSSRPCREWIMNPTGKSYVCILHEYVQHALKKQPSYEFKELEIPSTPYSATVTINGTHYGTATGASKKQAKLEAAKVALEILIPEMKNKFEMDNKSGCYNSSGLSIFDEIKIEDPRVAEFCAKTTEPSPYAILLTCLQRNYSLAEVKVQYSVNKTEHKRNVFTMQVGNHSCTITCKNKRDGKQRASQGILKSLHPHIISWGSLLRLYGNRSVKNVKEKKQEEQEITLLQSKASLNQPNMAILNKLRTEMKKLQDKKMSVRPIGKFVPPDDVMIPSLSSTDLNKIVL